MVTKKSDRAETKRFGKRPKSLAQIPEKSKLTLESRPYKRVLPTIFHESCSDVPISPGNSLLFAVMISD